MDCRMFSLEIDCDADDRDLLIAELWEQGSAGIVELSARDTEGQQLALGLQVSGLVLTPQEKRP